MRLGQMSFSGMFSYIPPTSIEIHTAPGFCIGEHIKPQDFTKVDLNQYLQNYESRRARAFERDEYFPEVIRHKVKVYVYCSPCACQIATALDVCQHTGTYLLVTFHIRIDYRQATSCCAPSSSLDGICSAIDHLKDVEKSDLYGIEPTELDRIKLIDRRWMELEEYRTGELEGAPESSPESHLTRIANYHRGAEDVAGIVILGEADYCVPLLGAHPFPSFEAGSRLRENMMFMLEQKYSHVMRGAWQRSYLGTYSSKPPITRNPSLPTTVDKRQSDDTPEEKSKRPKTQIAGQ